MSIQLIKNFGKKMSLLLVIFISTITHSSAQFLEETCSMPVLRIDGNSNGLYVEGSYSYVLGDKLKIFDISNPKVPIELGSEGFGDDYPFDLIIKANKAYVLCGDDTAISLKIRIIDVSDPSAPSTVGVTENLNIEWSYYIHNDYLYGIGYDPTRAQRFINVIDISDPTNSETIEKLFFESSGGGELYGSDNILFMTTYIGESHGFNVIDISDPHNIKIIHSSEILKESSFESVPYSSFFKLKKHGQYAYAVTKYSSTWGVTQRGYLVIIDVSNPENPIMKGADRVPYKTSTLHIDYPYAFVGSEYGLDIIDISDPNNPSAIQLNGYVDFNNDTEAYLNGIHAQLPYLHLSFSDKYQILDLSQCFPNNTTIAQWPMSGPGGTRFTQWGTGFTPNTIATLHFQKPDGTEYPTKDISIEQDGHFVDPYDAPLDKPIGDYTWWAVDTTGIKSNEVTYTITERAVPTIAQWPMKGTPGTTFTQWGSGFTPNSTGTLHVQKPDGTEYPTQIVTIDSDGRFRITHTSSWDKPFGTYSWWVEDGVNSESCTPLSYDIINDNNSRLAGFDITQNGDEIQEQHVGVPFEITISAMDGNGQIIIDFNEEVVLTSDLGQPTPMKVKLENGSISQSIILDMAGTGISLYAKGNGKGGKSNKFSVIGDSFQDSVISGFVKTPEGLALPFAFVTLVGNGYEKYKLTRENGFYEFNNLSPGCYTVYSEISTDFYFGKTKKYNPCVVPHSCYPLDMIIRDWDSDRVKTPILLVPGIMGSSVGDGIYPELPAEAPTWDGDWDTESWGLHDPMGLVGWRKIVELLKDADPLLRIGKDIYPVPYDWRMDIDEAAEKYLKPWINEAKERTKSDKVNIIAHSMGGLVTRAYIQNDEDFDHDVNKFAMVGTPNHGAGLVYYLTQGGDPITADKVSTLSNDDILPTNSLLSYAITRLSSFFVWK